MPFRIVCVIILASLSLCAQSQPQQPPKSGSTLSAVEADLAKYRLGKCEATLKATTDQYAQMKGQYDQLEKENEDLRVELALNEKAHTLLGFWIVGIVGGISIGAVILIAKWVRRMRPLAAATKQLMALVFGALWMSVAGFIAVNDSQLSRHPVNMAFMVVVYSLPAILFAAIAFWWFGKRNPVVTA